MPLAETMTDASVPADDRGSSFVFGPWPIALLAFVCTLLLSSSHNTFPYYYEPDAPTKVAQVISGERNFHHPLLMLTTTDLTVRALGIERNEQNVVVVGRWVVAVFMSVAVAALTVLAWMYGGVLAALAAAALLATQHRIFELPHYMKEDPALVMGIALSFLAMEYFWRSPTLKRTAWLGAAVSVAISGKYVGIAMLILALPLVFFAGGSMRSRLVRAAVFVVAMLVALAVINYQLFTHFGAFEAGLHQEVGKLSAGSKVNRVPHIRATVDVFKSNTVLPLWIFIAFQTLWLFVWRRAKSPVEWMLFGYPFLYALVLMMTPKLYERYFLPVVTLEHFIGALGVVNLAAFLAARAPEKRWIFPAVATASIAIVTAWQGRDLARYYTAIKSDHRGELIAWSNAHLRPNSVIAYDKRVFLKGPRDENADAIHFRVIPAGLVARAGSVEKLRRDGVTHVAIHDLDSGKFLPGGKGAGESAKSSDFGEEITGLRAFGKSLHNEGELIWARLDGTAGYLNPGLKLFALDKSAAGDARDIEKRKRRKPESGS